MLVRWNPNHGPPPLKSNAKQGDEVASTTAPSDQTAVKTAIVLLARSQTLRPCSRLMPRLADDVLQCRGEALTPDCSKNRWVVAGTVSPLGAHLCLASLPMARFAALRTRKTAVAAPPSADKRAFSRVASASTVSRLPYST